MKRIVLLLSMACCLLTIAGLPVLAAGQPEKPATQAAIATININTASAAELQGLPGVGKTTAANIVAYRTEKGKFKSQDELLKVKGIGPKTYEKLKSLISVE